MSIENIGTGIFILLLGVVYLLGKIESKLRINIQDNRKVLEVLKQIKDDISHQNSLIERYLYSTSKDDR